MLDSVCTSCEYVDGTLPSLLLMCQKLSFICIYMYRPTNGDDVATCVTTALSNHVRTLVLKYLHTYLQTALSKSILPYSEMCKLSRAVRIAFSYFNFWQMIPFQTSYCSGGGETICPPPMAVPLAVVLRPSADGSAVRTPLSCRQPACL